MTFRPFTSTIAYPQFRTIDDARAWAIGVFDLLADWETRMNAVLNEARKSTGAALTAAVAGSANSGDGTTDDIIEANRTRVAEIEAILVANGLVEE